MPSSFHMLLVGLAAFAVSSANAAELKPYTSAALQAANLQKRPVLVHVHANWCSTCKAQVPVIQSVASAPEFDRLLVLTLDFDHQKPERKALGVGRQSTLVAFGNGREQGRSTGQTQRHAIAELMAKTLNK